MKNLELEVRRNPEFTKDYTAGQLYIDGEFFFYTLEDEVREVPGKPVKEWKQYGITAIPRGRYRVILTESKKFGRLLPELLNVEGYVAIRIHALNTAQQSEGCIGVGLSDGNSKDAWLGNSRKAEGQLIKIINEAINGGRQVWITLEGGGDNAVL